MLRLFRYIPETIKQPIRNLAGLSHPYGLPMSEQKRLQSWPRQQDTTVRLFGKDFEICDAASFLSSHKDIFVRKIYEFKTDCPEPVIIDAGANVGLAALYFAQKAPGARIISIEADKHIAELLARNVARFDLRKVDVVFGAAWKNRESLRFSSDHTDAGRVSGHGNELVPGIRVRDFLVEQPIDLLKLDIEGAETIVLQDCADMLHRVKRIFVEYHSIHGQLQTLSTVLQLLESTGFRYYIDRTGVHSSRPLVERHVESGFDLQLNVYAIRELDAA